MENFFHLKDRKKVMQDNNAFCLLSIPSSAEHVSNLLSSWPCPMVHYRAWWNCSPRLCSLLLGWLCARSLGALHYILGQFSSNITHAHEGTSVQSFLLGGISCLIWDLACGRSTQKNRMIQSP